MNDEYRLKNVDLGRGRKRVCTTESTEFHRERDGNAEKEWKGKIDADRVNIKARAKELKNMSGLVYTDEWKNKGIKTK